MSLLESIILGALQGITEFLPISSTAHLALLPWIVGWKDEGLAFNVALHVGSLFAIIGYFWRDWVEIITEFLQGVFSGSMSGRPQGQVGLYILIATVPGAISGVLLEEHASGILRHPMFIAGSLTFFGILLFIADRYSRRERSVMGMNLVDCLIIGAAQAIAVIPGVSRSGITITGGLFRGFKRDEAAKFSFLLGAPLIAGAAVYEARKIDVSMVTSTPFIVGVLTSAIFAFLAMKYLLRFVRRESYTAFVVYRVVLSLVIVFLFLSRSTKALP